MLALLRLDRKRGRKGKAAPTGGKLVDLSSKSAKASNPAIVVITSFPIIKTYAVMIWHVITRIGYSPKRYLRLEGELGA